MPVEKIGKEITGPPPEKVEIPQTEQRSAEIVWPGEAEPSVVRVTKIYPGPMPGGAEPPKIPAAEVTPTGEVRMVDEAPARTVEEYVERLERDFPELKKEEIESIRANIEYIKTLPEEQRQAEFEKYMAQWEKTIAARRTEAEIQRIRAETVRPAWAAVRESPLGQIPIVGEIATGFVRFFEPFGKGLAELKTGPIKTTPEVVKTAFGEVRLLPEKTPLIFGGELVGAYSLGLIAGAGTRAVVGAAQMIPPAAKIGAKMSEIAMMHRTALAAGTIAPIAAIHAAQVAQMARTGAELKDVMEYTALSIASAAGAVRGYQLISSAAERRAVIKKLDELLLKSPERVGAEPIKVYGEDVYITKPQTEITIERGARGIYAYEKISGIKLWEMIPQDMSESARHARILKISPEQKMMYVAKPISAREVPGGTVFAREEALAYFRVMPRADEFQLAVGIRQFRIFLPVRGEAIVQKAVFRPPSPPPSRAISPYRPGAQLGTVIPEVKTIITSSGQMQMLAARPAVLAISATPAVIAAEKYAAQTVAKTAAAPRYAQKSMTKTAAIVISKIAQPLTVAQKEAVKPAAKISALAIPKISLSPLVSPLAKAVSVPVSKTAVRAMPSLMPDIKKIGLPVRRLKAAEKGFAAPPSFGDFSAFKPPKALKIKRYAPRLRAWPVGKFELPEFDVQYKKIIKRRRRKRRRTWAF